MKTIIKLIACTLLIIVNSCDYLQVVPDQVATIEMAFTDRYTTERYLVTCYWGMPKSAGWNENPAIFGAMEMCMNKYQQNQGGMQFGLGKASANNPLIDYWGGGGDMIRSLHAGIRECNTFMEGVMGVADLDRYMKVRMYNEAKLIKAYMHLYLLSYYGPVCPLRESAPVNESTKGVRVYREKVDDCFAYVIQLIDEVIESNSLPLTIINASTELGRFTLPVAYYLKAKALTYWASPLFNGNTDYNSFFNQNGEPFFNQTYDASLWTKAAEACKRAVHVCDSAGIRLYQKEDYRSSKTLPEEILLVQALRSSVSEIWSIELIWGNSSYMPTEGRMQGPCLPRLEQATSQSTSGNMSVPFGTVDVFYTQNGIPMEEDPEYDYANRFNIRTGDEEHKYYIKKGEQTAAMNFDREPRFYSTLGFDRGIWYGNHYNNLPDDPSEALYPKDRLNEYSSVFNFDSYNTTGYWPKKLVNLNTVYRDPNNVFTQVYPWPDMRFADLILFTAETLNESKDAPDAEVYQYIDMIRERAGLEGVIDSWKKSINPNKPTTKTGMRDIIQRERKIEFACEGVYYWDSRRWKTAVKEQNRSVQGWNITASDVNEYYIPTTHYIQNFTYRDYLAPIPEYDIVKNPNLVQNPGW